MRRLVRGLHLTALALGLSLSVDGGSAGASNHTQEESSWRFAGTVIDSLSGDGVSNATVRVLGEEGVARITDSAGRFLFERLQSGIQRLEIQHVAYRTSIRDIVVKADSRGGWIEIRLSPRAYLLDEVRAEAGEVTPLTGRSTYRVAAVLVRELAFDDLVEAVELLPGVTVSGGRPFFRGIGLEQILPLLDGVPAREPIKNRWILPPPQAVSSAEFISEASGTETGQALAGVMTFRLAEGGDSHRARLSVRTDRLGISDDLSTRTDHVAANASGPTPQPGLFYSLSWQGNATDSHLWYPDGRPEQSIMGAVSIGESMSARESASAKLTWRPSNRGLKWTASVTHSRDRSKPYHHHYSRTGWVGYDPEFDRYSTFLDDPAEADSAVFYNGPAGVPIYELHSTLALTTLSWMPSRQASLRLHASYGRHRHHAAIAGLSLTTDEQLSNWARSGFTSTAHQEEWFYATHGILPEFESGLSKEGSVGATASFLVHGDHDLRAGVGIVGGRHRYAALSSPVFFRGSLEDPIDVIDGYGFVQDTWYSDRLSSMTLALRYDIRRVRGPQSSESASRWSPGLSFHQPMTEQDALDVRASLSYQFPALETYFVTNQDQRQTIGLDAQRLRSFQIGVQHHFSSKVVGYLGAYRREYTKIVFSQTSPTALEAAFGVKERPPETLDATGLEAVVDHQIHPRLVGQANLTWSRTTTQDAIEVPWSRSLSGHTWLSWRPVNEGSLTMTARWDTGRPYSVCIEAKGCDDSELHEGQLPDFFEIDLGVRWGPRHSRLPIQLLFEVRNLLDRKIPTFDFGIHPMRIGSGNFIAFYDETGETGGYIVDVGSSEFRGQLHNPQTRSDGLRLLLGVEVRL